MIKRMKTAEAATKALEEQLNEEKKRVEDLNTTNLRLKKEHSAKMLKRKEQVSNLFSCLFTFLFMRQKCVSEMSLSF